MNGNIYRQMLQDNLFHEMEDMNTENTWFQQDGATAHTARETMDMLRTHFPNREIRVLVTYRGRQNLQI